MTSRRAALIFMLYTTAYVWFLGVLLDGLESMRYMWLVWAFVIVLAVMAIRWFYRRVMQWLSCKIEQIQYGDKWGK